MTPTDTLPTDLKAAIEDLRRIREVVDASETTHPLRYVARPLLRLTTVFGVLTAAFGIVAQLVLIQGPTVLGLSTQVFVAALAGLFIGFGGIAKWVVVSASSRKAGYDVLQIVRMVMGPRYMRLVLPSAAIIVVGTSLLVSQGAERFLVPFLTVVIGAVMVEMPLIIPFKETTIPGLVALVLGVLGLFFFTAWPFFQLAVLWGVPFLVAGVLYANRFPAPGSEQRSVGT